MTSCQFMVGQMHKVCQPNDISVARTRLVSAIRRRGRPEASVFVYSRIGANRTGSQSGLEDRSDR